MIGFKRVIATIAPLFEDGLSLTERKQIHNFYNSSKNYLTESAKNGLATFIRSGFTGSVFKLNFFGDNPLRVFNRSDGKKFTWNWQTVNGFDGKIDQNNLFQNQLGSCCILATVDQFKLIYNDNNTISVKVLNRWITTDNKLPTGDVLTKGDPDAPLVEKVLAVFKQQNYGVKNGYDLVGNGQMLPDELKKLFGLSTRVFVSRLAVDDFLVANHAYRIIGENNDSYTLFNPWGKVATYQKSKLTGVMY